MQRLQNEDHLYETALREEKSKDCEFEMAETKGRDTAAYAPFPPSLREPN